jgi:hypothetical protein
MKKMMDKLPKHKFILDPKSYRMAHPVYSLKDIEGVQVTHRERVTWKDKLAYMPVVFARKFVDTLSGYNPDTFKERDWLNRIIFLETVAGVPGMIGGMQRHMRSLRTLERDHGWIHHLLQEAENERMHLFFFLTQRNPGIMFRTMIVGAQGIFFHGYFLAYLLSPSLCHRFVGYLEEEAVHTYTILLKCIDEGKLPVWTTMPAPKEAIDYYSLPEDAVMRDLILAVRADESCHREVNHHFADCKYYEPIDHSFVEVSLKGDDGAQSLNFSRE